MADPKARKAASQDLGIINQRRAELAEKGNRNPEDLQYGLIVIVTARWALALTALLLLLWKPPGLLGLQLGVLLILALVTVNFFLHAQILRQRPISTGLSYLMSLADLGVISLMVGIRGGFQAYTFVYYYPAILAYSLLFPGGVTLLLTGGAAAAYALNSLATPEISFESVIDQQILVSRLLVMVAVAYLGYRYRLVEERRLTEASRRS